MVYQVVCTKHGTINWAAHKSRALAIAKEHDNKEHQGYMFCSVIKAG